MSRVQDQAWAPSAAPFDELDVAGQLVMRQCSLGPPHVKEVNSKKVLTDDMVEIVFKGRGDADFAAAISLLLECG